MILLFVLLYISLTGCFLNKENTTESPFLRIAFLKATLVLSGLFYASTEVLSQFDKIDATSARAFWSIATIIGLGIAFKRKPDFLVQIFKRIKIFFSQKEYLLYTIVALCVPLLFIALFVPTTNNDSLNYYVPRVIYWIYNKDVDFFPTLNSGQLYYGPFAEYIILQLQLVTGSIVYSNLPQFVSMTGSLVTVSLISEKLFHSKAARNLSVLLAFTLPIGLFESTTTQNDYVCAFYVLTSIFFIMEAYLRLNHENIIMFTLALGFCGLTKFSGWVFAVPFLIFYTALILKRHRLQLARYLPAALAIFIVILAPFTKRNQDTFHIPIGTKEGQELYSGMMNMDIGFVNTLSTTVKNIGTAAATPISAINEITKSTVVAFNKVMRKDVDEKDDNYLSMPYSNSFSFHEDRASNFLHFWLFLLSVIPAFFLPGRKKIFVCLGLLWSAFILFSMLFKWQPWNNRIELIWFMTMMPVLGYIYDEFLQKKIYRFVLTSLLLLYAMAIILLNPSKQIIPLLDLSKAMPTFFSEYDFKKLEQHPDLKDRVITNTNALKEFGLNFYLPKEETDYTDAEKAKILEVLNFPVNASIYKKSYVERMMPLDMTIYHQMNNMMKYIDQPNARIGLSLLAGTREFLILYPLSLRENIVSVKNIAYPKSLSQTPHSTEPYEYDYLLTNNFLLFNEIDNSSVASIQDFAYFKLYKFHQPQTRKYQVLDIPQDFSM